MPTPVPASIAPTRILHAMIRVSGLGRSIAFYRDMLGMSEMGRETYPEAEFTVVFMGYGDRTTQPTVELTYNWGDHAYEQGTAFGNISLAVGDVYALEAHLSAAGVDVLRPAGEMPIASTETGRKAHLAFIADPDGYRVELMQSA